MRLKMWKEFKAFIMRGNVIDLAVGVVIGAAFGKIVNSIIADIIMPPLGLLISNVDFRDIKFRLGGSDVKPVFLSIGNFVQVIIEFLIIAFVIFIIIKAINKLHKKEEKPPEEPKPTNEELLLTEIRDVLKSK
jgi:large conductance mechanosensitive channel